MRSQADIVGEVLCVLADGEHMTVEGLRRRLQVRRQRMFAVLALMTKDGAVEGRLEMIVAKDGKRRRLRVYFLPERVQEPGSRAPQPGSQIDSGAHNASEAPQST